MSPARMIAAVLVTAAATAALGFASRASYTPEDANDAVLRLSWRLRGEKIRNCRDRTQAELDALPIHMRTPQICTEHLLSYKLRLEIDDETVDTLTFEPEGAKGDRPIFVLHETRLTPGVHEVEIDFTPSTIVPGTRRAPLRYEGEIDLEPGRISLITIAPDASELMLRR